MAYLQGTVWSPQGRESVGPRDVPPEPELTRA